MAFPTETVYGLGANALDPEAVAGIFEAKGRPSDNPLIVHVASPSEVGALVRQVPGAAAVLMEAFWPGPLTLVMPKAEGVPDAVTAGLDTVGVRMPRHAVALELIRLAGVPVAAPSANRSGRPSPTAAEHVAEDLSGRVDVILDGGPTGVGVESTVLDLTGRVPIVLRPGGVTPEDLSRALGAEVEVDPRVLVTGGTSGPVRSPGMKYRHYAPRAELWLFEAGQDGVPGLEWMAGEIRRRAGEARSRGLRVGIMASDETLGLYGSGPALTFGASKEQILVLSVGSRADLATVAANLFGTLRAFDAAGVDVILAEGYEGSGLGLAVMNRLRRAAGGRVVPDSYTRK